jgi:DNA-binding CsgD family transcriptional regulator
VASLSDRELRVFELLGCGLRPSEIAKELSISVKTVETHLGRIRSKFSLGSTHELARHAVLWVQQASQSRPS